jgi:hypothetical protein
MQVAAVAEAAALAGLPVEPSAYGLPSAASRRLPATRDIFTPAAGSLRQARPTQAERDELSEQDPDRSRDDGPAVWSTP